MFAEFHESPTLHNRYTDAAASAIADAARRTLLLRPARLDRNQVTILTGCPASGKTGSAGPRQNHNVEIQHETILSSLPRAIELVEQALASDRFPVIRLFYTDDPRINAERMIRRATQIGRTVPLKYIAETYIGVPTIVSELESQFGEKIRIRVTNNSENPQNVIHHNRIDRALYHVGRYTSESALEAMHARVDELAGGSDKISDEILREARR